MLLPRVIIGLIAEAIEAIVRVAARVRLIGDEQFELYDDLCNDDLLYDENLHGTPTRID